MKPLLALFVVTLVACKSPPSIDDLCERVATCGASTPVEEEGVLNECLSEGDFIAERAFESDCEGELDDYLCCIDEAECDWWFDCEEERDEFSYCIGELPLD